VCECLVIYGNDVTVIDIGVGCCILIYTNFHIIKVYDCVSVTSN